MLTIRGLPVRRAFTRSIATFKVPEILNEPVRSYERGSADRRGVLAAIEKLKGSTVDVPLVIGGKEIYTHDRFSQPSPYNHQIKLANVSSASEKDVSDAIKASLDAKKNGRTHHGRTVLLFFSRQQTSLQESIVMTC
jgi:1-pyrroline-5-carboxylate dehydrogenase